MTEGGKDRSSGCRAKRCGRLGSISIREILEHIVGVEERTTSLAL